MRLLQKQPVRGRARQGARAPLQQFPRAARVEYTSALLDLVSDLQRATERVLLPDLPRLLERFDQVIVRLDAAPDDAESVLKRLRQAFGELLNTAVGGRIARRIGRRTAAFNKQQINRQFRETLGIELLSGEPGLQPQLELFVQDNARLITKMADDVRQNIAGAVLHGARAGVRHETLAKELAETFKMTERRAALIARDQVAKLNGELTQIRQQSIGVEEYIWLTAQDERVRSRHAELHGTRQRWDSPPTVDFKRNRREHPGGDINCRCTAKPVLDKILAALAAPNGAP